MSTRAPLTLFVNFAIEILGRNKRMFQIHMRRHEANILNTNQPLVGEKPDGLGVIEEEKEHSTSNLNNFPQKKLPSAKSPSDDSRKQEEVKVYVYESDDYALDVVKSNSQQDSIEFGYKKRFKSIESQGHRPFLEDSDSHSKTSKAKGSKCSQKKSDNVSLFNDSSVKDEFLKQESELKSIQKFSQHQYMCQEVGCFKSFYSEYNLRIHLKTTHLKIREYRCKLCSTEYLHKKNLVDHIKRDHTGFLHCPEAGRVEYRVGSSQGMLSQKERSDSESGEVPFWPKFLKTPSEPKSLASVSDCSNAVYQE